MTDAWWHGAWCLLEDKSDRKKEKKVVSLFISFLLGSYVSLHVGEHEEEWWVCKLAVTGYFCRESEDILSQALKNIVL